MSKQDKKKEKNIARQMRFRFLASVLICLAVIAVLSFGFSRAYETMASAEKRAAREAASLSEEIDGIVVAGPDTGELEELKETYEHMSGREQRQVTSQRYDKLTEAIHLARMMGEEEFDLVVEDKGKNGFDMNLGEIEKAELKAYDTRAAFEGQADVDGAGAKEIFDRLFNGKHSFTVEAELNPNGGDDFNMIMSKGDNCAALRISEQSVYFFIKNTAGAWMGARERLSEENMHSWIHVAGVYDGNNLSVYLEGSGMTTEKNVGRILASDFPLGVGYCPETKRNSVASIRKFHIYSQALTEAQLDQGSYGPDSDKTVLWYDFDDYTYTGLDAQTEGIRCYTDSLHVEEGQTVPIRTETVPYYAGGDVVFQSDNEKVAMISRDGVVTGVKEGTTTVTAAVEGTDFSVKIPVKVGGMLLSAEQMLGWFVDHMVFIDAVIFVIALFGIMLIQRRQLIFYLGRLSDAIPLIGKNAGEMELPGILSDAGNGIRQVEENFRKKDYVAREAEQRKNDLVVYLAHDLKTPIASLMGYLTLLRDEKQISPELHQHYVEIALSNSERLDDLINEFFEITRFNMSHITLNYGSINLTWFLEQLVSEFQPMMAEKGLTCRLDIARNVIIRCDGDKMERVFNNLLRNAVNYSYRDTEIRLVAVVGEQVEVTCMNYSETIPKEQLERIFDQFYRLDRARSTSTGSSGLGLAIARQIVELHGGNIRADSREGKIWFTVTIPLQEPDET